MLVETAIRLIQNVVYKPDWLFACDDYSKRYENAVRVRIDYPAQETSRSEAAAGYPHDNYPYAEFILMVGNVDDIELYRKLADAIMTIECHEMREYLRVKPTYWAPFHPHNEDGMKRWAKDGSYHDDLKFGLA